MSGKAQKPLIIRGDTKEEAAHVSLPPDPLCAGAGLNQAQDQAGSLHSQRMRFLVTFAPHVAAAHLLD